MSVHEQFAEDLALQALGSLTGEEHSALGNHLESCADCRRELEQLRGDMALMAMSTAGPKPPVRARQRLLHALAKEPRRSMVEKHRTWWSWMRAFAGAAFAMVALLLWVQNSALRERMVRQQQQLAEQQAALQRARELVSTLTATDAMRVTLVAAQALPQPQGKAIYVRDRASLIFIASNLQALPAEKAYELWLIPNVGIPIPAGVFKPDAHGSATVVDPPLPKGVEAKAFAITVEPAAGSTAPTMPIVMMGAGE